MRGLLEIALKASRSARYTASTTHAVGDFGMKSMQVKSADSKERQSNHGARDRPERSVCQTSCPGAEYLDGLAEFFNRKCAAVGRSL